MKVKLKDGTTGVSVAGTPLEIDAQGCVEVTPEVADMLVKSHGHAHHVPKVKAVRVRVPKTTPPTDDSDSGSEGDEGDDGDEGE
jgi:hypothetical protein